MAANNYYNFTHGGTQYGTQFTPPAGGQAYPAPTAAYSAQPPATGQAFAPPGTESYVLQGYTRPAAQQQQQGYYGQGQAAGYTGAQAVKLVGAAPLRPAATSTTYPSYSANTTGTTSSASYAGFAPPQAQTTPGPGGKSFTNYDAAVYNAVSAYAQGGSTTRGGGGARFNKGMKVKGQRPMPKPQTLHYCDVCKISCAGPQTYKEHLEGQKHKKKEAAQKTGVVAAPKGPAGLRCELCDVTCTGSDAYAAHIRGSKHQKVVKLHTKLGKPIPSESPTVVATPTGSSNSVSALKTTSIPGTILNSTTGNGNSVTRTPATPVPAPKITFAGGGTPTNSGTTPTTPAATTPNPGNPQSGGTVPSDSKPIEESPPQPLSTTYATPAAPGNNVSPSSDKQMLEYIEKDVQPVGQDYIEEIRNEEGKAVSFNCKLCECRFNDPNAKEMHMKGRRHRLQYKKKVNPDLVVDIKPSSRQKKIEERRASRNMPMPMRKSMNNDMYGRGPGLMIPPGGRGFGPPGPGYGPGPGPYFGPPPPMLRRVETIDDRHVMAKHAEIYPEEDELQAIQKIVSNTEKALKIVSDKFAEEDAKSTHVQDSMESTPPTEADLQIARKLKGVMRVGNLAKGLLLRGDRLVELVVLCSEKPTVSMLDRIYESLPSQMEMIAPEEKYEFNKAVEKAGIQITDTLTPKIEVMVTLTSPLLRTNGTEAPGGEAEATQVSDPHDLLDKEKCLDALAALRHAKWFQARATTLQSCVIVIRIMRDLCRKVPELQSIPEWAVELLAQTAINTAGMPVSPGEAIRILFEVLASGFVLPTGPGLLDPCEKDHCDALGSLSAQAREDITAFSQRGLRQIVFRQIHLALGMEPLPRFNKSSFANRKRRRDPSGNADGDEADAINDLKKDKKEETNGTETETTAVKTEPMS